MSSGKEAARDLRYGRRGGHWLPDGYEPTVVSACDVCGEPSILGRHAGCEPAVEPVAGPASLF